MSLLLLFAGASALPNSPVVSGPLVVTTLTNKPAGPFYSKKEWAELLAGIAHERDLEQIDRDAQRKAQKLAEARAYRAAFLARWRR
jgi:hypothetical protein